METTLLRDFLTQAVWAHLWHWFVDGSDLVPMDQGMRLSAAPWASDLSSQSGWLWSKIPPHPSPSRATVRILTV